PLVFHNPLGNFRETEFNSMAAVAMVDALMKIILAKYSVTFFVFASITRTPVALFFLSSKITSTTIESGNKVILPDATAAGRVAALLLKYPLNGHPRSQRFRNWHGPRPFNFSV